MQECMQFANKNSKNCSLTKFLMKILSYKFVLGIVCDNSKWNIESLNVDSY